MIDDHAQGTATVLDNTFFWWREGGKCVMHRNAIKALCVGLRQGLPVGLLARWIMLTFSIITWYAPSQSILN